MEITTGAESPELLKPEEVAARLRVSERTLMRWRAEGTSPLRHVKVGGQVRYVAADVEALLALATKAAS